MDVFLWVIVPYLCLATFVVGHFWRYRYDKFGWTTRSSQLYEDRMLRVGSPLFHFGMLGVVGGHGPGQEVLQVGKKEVNIRDIEPVGVYAVKLGFTDGHDTGIYSWEYLYDLGLKQDTNWKTYLARLAQAGKSREP